MTDLTKASEARSRVLRLAGINAPALTIGAALDAYAAAVRSDTLADVAARLPEALAVTDWTPAWRSVPVGDHSVAGWDEHELAAILMAHLTGGTDR